jgi:hypothetical protein
MSMRFIRRSSMLLGAAAVLCSFGSMSAEAATIVPTGGSFGNMKPTGNIPAAYGTTSGYSEITYLFDNFGQNPYLITSTASEVSTTVTEDSLSLSGVARSFYDATHFDVVSGSMGGTTGFDLTESTLTRFSLTQPHGAWINTASGLSITLRDAAGAIVLGCIGEGLYYNVTGGCRRGSQPTNGDQSTNLEHDGLLQLAAGHYDLSFSGSGRAVAGVAVTTDFDFQLATPVPLPASGWLLVSGLGLLARRRRRAAEA